MNAAAYAALWIFVFSVPWENIILIPGIGTIGRLMGMVALGFAVLAAIVQARIRRPQPFHIAAATFVVWTGIGVFRAMDEARSISKFGTYLQLLLVLWMIWELAPSFKKQRGLFLAYVLGAYVAAINTVMAYRAGIGSTNQRFTAEGFDPNDLGMTLALAIPMAWYLGMTYRQHLMRWVCRLYIPLALVAIGLTGSRGALIACIIALLIVPVSLTQLSPGRIAAAVLLIFASGAAAVTFIPQTSWDRFATTRYEVVSGNMNSRLVVWKMALQAYSHRPLVGYGTSGFNWAVRSQAHNSYLAVLVEQGIIGFAMYMAMFIAVFIKIMRMPRMERRFALVLLATLLVAMLPLGWDDRKPVWVIPALLTALGAAVAPPAPGVRQAVPQQRLPRRPPLPARQPASS